MQMQYALLCLRTFGKRKPLKVIKARQFALEPGDESSHFPSDPPRRDRWNPSYLNCTVSEHRVAVPSETAAKLVVRHWNAFKHAPVPSSGEITGWTPQAECVLDYLNADCIQVRGEVRSHSRPGSPQP
jgi:hypothetical protein